MRSAHALTASLLALLAGCSSTPAASPTTSNSTPAAPSATSAASAPSATSEPGQTAATSEPEQPPVAETRTAEPARHVLLPRLSDLNGTEHDLPTALARGETVALLVWWPSSGCEDLALRVAAAAAEHGHAVRFLGIVPAPREGLGYDNLVRGTAADWELDLPSVLDPGADLAQRLRGAPLEVPDVWGSTGDAPASPWLTVVGAEGRVLWSAADAPPAWETLHGKPRADTVTEPEAKAPGAGATR